jgi:hypothetical protein
MLQRYAKIIAWTILLILSVLFLTFVFLSSYIMMGLVSAWTLILIIWVYLGDWPVEEEEDT